MCGIVGYIGFQLASEIILDGLKRLEYRGYDSAGIAVISEKGQITVRREVGKLNNLIKDVMTNPLIGNIGMGHTRWATHGRPTVYNAHPHSDDSGKIVVIHNGIIENYLILKEELKKKYEFKSDTDTEVVAHLIRDNYEGDLYQAVQKALKKVKGAYSLVVLHADHPEYFVAAKTSSPLIVGIGDGENFVASDVPAILNYTRDIVYLEDGELAVVYKDKVDFFNLAGESVTKKVSKISWNIATAEKGGYEHFMLKEIYDQPKAIAQAIAGRVSEDEGKIYLDDLNISSEDLKSINRITILACGTSYYAGLIGKYYIEKFAKIPVDVDLASEFRYREPFADENTLVIAISQSGETADTLAAVKLAKQLGSKTIGVLNVIGSAISRETKGNLYIHCDPEIGVASTKAFTSTIACMYMMALYFGQLKSTITKEFISKSIVDLKTVPSIIEKVFLLKDEIKNIAKKLANYNHCLFLGRNYNFPIALEGALKLKELSYIHAEGYAAGEMKHGPIALIDKDMPVLSIATDSETYDKVVSNIKEVKARDA
ncbi:MAG: glutamine--fructose-6-phosphate transaminase (isomerizing), partial [Candidatus Sericytochromatia bacterium]|nr:glutamine--fructose-6-phosphate transaminase (isomerizing) [Candidatus Sericytochromatia bacterium]